MGYWCELLSAPMSHGTRGPPLGAEPHDRWTRQASQEPRMQILYCFQYNTWKLKCNTATRKNTTTKFGWQCTCLSSVSHNSWIDSVYLKYFRWLVCPSVRLSICMWTKSCLLCIFYNTYRIHFIFIHSINRKVCYTLRLFFLINSKISIFT